MQIPAVILQVNLQYQGNHFFIREELHMESSCEEIIRLANKVLVGGEITREEAGRLIRTKDEDTMLVISLKKRNFRQPRNKGHSK